MARVTIEDCEAVVPNRFDLVLLAAQRARQIDSGDPVTINAKDEKKPVVALREIAAETVSVENLKESLINSFRSFIPDDSDTEDITDLDDDYNPYVGMEHIQNEEQVIENVANDAEQADDWDSEEEEDDTDIDDEVSEN